MHAFLITQSTAEERKYKAHELISQERIETKNIFLLAKDQSKKSIGIEDTAALKYWLAQKSEKTRVLLVEEAQFLTIPAQQSLLKTIEEPGGSALIIMTADSEMSLLPTVRSRCKIIRLKPDKLKESRFTYSTGSEQASQDKKIDIMGNFPFGKNVGEKILWLYSELSKYAGKKISPHYGSIGRETGMGFIEKIIEEVDSLTMGSRNKCGTTSRTMGKIINQAATAHARLKQNISPTLVLQEFVLNL